MTVARAMQHPLAMQFDDDDQENGKPLKRCDVTAMKILEDYVASHNGVQPTGVVVDRDFVVAESPKSPR